MLPQDVIVVLNLDRAARLERDRRRLTGGPRPARQHGLVNVRFAPKATEVLRCREASLCQNRP
jgi:hypothetical protein